MDFPSAPLPDLCGRNIIKVASMRITSYPEELQTDGRVFLLETHSSVGRNTQDIGWKAGPLDHHEMGVVEKAPEILHVSISRNASMPSTK